MVAAKPVAAQDPVSPRNIVFIFSDDQRFDELGLRNDYFETPRLDQLAEAGILFENAFVTTSLCSPSRASILSGLYAHTHQVLDNSTAMPTDLPTFPVGLQAAGYETAFVGKWHMGGASDDPRPGFDHWVSFRGQGSYVDPTLNINGTRTEHQGYTTDILTDYAVEFLRGEHDRPFMLYLSHKARRCTRRSPPPTVTGVSTQTARMSDRRRWPTPRRTTAANLTGCEHSATAGTGSTGCTTGESTSTGSCRSTPRR